ncbi:MAG: UDP-N-acetylmuramoyl-tripeptide--D-alanyl-D-alanine ligase [Myxococcales bacterium]|nr:UDP-N-acetylmuramoyl-tripeptide--D-alanyl-D-alanine ligase [Myxococcales bacterium]
MATPLPANEAALSLRDMAEATGGTLHGSFSGLTRGISTDTRTLTSGAAFVALKGERFDGHDHLDVAVSRGARVLVVNRGRAPSKTSAAVLEVDDTLSALAALAGFHAQSLRARRPVPVVAVSGAVGKTSTKELLRAALTAAFGPTLATEGNLNNLVGAPLTLLGLSAEHRAAVIECGSNAPGEIAKIAAMVRPDVALCTNADAAHTEFLGSVAAVAEEEGSVFAYAQRAAVANVDEPFSRAQLERAGDTVVRWLFGEKPEANIYIVSRKLRPDGRAEVLLSLDSTRCRGRANLTIVTSLLGPAAATNLAAAVSATLAAGADPTRLPAIAAALGTVGPVPGRLVPVQLSRDVLVLDDTYNASPRAVRLALETARELADARRAKLVLALGDMLELGALSEDAHRAAGEGVVAARADALVAVGPAMAEAAKVAEAAGLRVVRVAHSDEAGDRLAELVEPSTVVLLKGSRGMRLERAMTALVGRYPLEGRD